MPLCSYPPEEPECENDDSPLVEEAIANIEDVPPGTKKTFEVRGRKILVINDEGRLLAINGLCSHYNFPLENGIYAKGRIRCPLHGACFNVRTGDIEDYPGFDSLHSYQVSNQNGKIGIKTTEKKLGSDRKVRALPKMKKCDDRPVVVIGGGIAASTFIEHSRLNGLVTPIVVISEESFPPYDRVLLSKENFG
uniref:Rieske domain-containing protein n=1 Tax=Caenorhabditis japonica TaxID=281687 RepID=A0A8R1IQ62_CAEJA